MRLVRYTAEANENGLELFSSHNASRVNRNMEAAQRAHFPSSSSAVRPACRADRFRRNPADTGITPPRRGHNENRCFAREKKEGHETDITLTQRTS
jgi:hypothetical protein